MTPEYRAWANMLQRCANPKCEKYKDYGGRGITVAERWKTFSNFLFDMGPRPDPTFSLERLKVNEGYCPDNCVWADKATQARNRRTWGRSEYRGVSYSKQPPHWQAKISVDGKLRFIGRFNDEQEAAFAYDEAARISLGHNAVLNFPTLKRRMAA